MSNNIEWKKSSIDYSKLNKISHSDIVRIENGKNAILSGQHKKAAIKGGKVMGEKHLNNRTGLFSRSKKKRIEDATKAGKIGGKKTAELGYLKKAGQISSKSPKHPNNILIKCTHCGKETNLPLNKRWHGDNCKHKK